MVINLDGEVGTFNKIDFGVKPPVVEREPDIERWHRAKEEPEIDIRAALEIIFSSLKSGKRFRYKSHGGTCGAVPLERTTERAWVTSFSTQSVQTTKRRRGGDCDDLALSYAFELKLRVTVEGVEFGVIDGNAKLSGRNYYCLHSVLAVRDIRTGRYELYAVANFKDGPYYVGSYVRTKAERFPVLRKNRSFLLNVYTPVGPGGNRDIARAVYFVP